MVQKALSSIKSTTAPGHDKFPGFVLKRLAGALAPNITTIYNSSIHNNIVPNSWKMAEVKAIYKQKGSKSDPNNYRPISVLPILGRTLEKLVATQLYAYCDTHNILPLEQFGFRRHSSCEMALFAATDSWMKSVDRGSFAGALLVDLSKAFDTVPHQLLLSELRDIGCSIEVLLWFCDYLTHRLQRVITYEEITDWIMVSSSVVTVLKFFLSVGFGRFWRKNLGFRFGFGFHDKCVVNYFMSRAIWYHYYHP